MSSSWLAASLDCMISSHRLIPLSEVSSKVWENDLSWFKFRCYCCCEVGHLNWTSFMWTLKELQFLAHFIFQPLKLLLERNPTNSFECQDLISFKCSSKERITWKWRKLAQVWIFTFSVVLNICAAKWTDNFFYWVQTDENARWSVSYANLQRAAQREDYCLVFAYLICSCLFAVFLCMFKYQIKAREGEHKEETPCGEAQHMCSPAWVMGMDPYADRLLPDTGSCAGNPSCRFTFHFHVSFTAST